MSYGFMSSVYPPVSAGYVLMNCLKGAFPPSCKKGLQHTSSGTLVSWPIAVTKHRAAASRTMHMPLF